MKAIKQIWRLIFINYVLVKNGFDQVIVSIPIFYPIRFIVYLNPWNWFRNKNFTRGEALRTTFEELGPIFVKFGQALSTRPDILPADIALELCKLQDKVPPFPSSTVIKIMEETYRTSPFELFQTFNPEPMASASIAQVHEATLKTGEEVVVKILRPGIKKIIKQDLTILHTFANLAEKYWQEGKRYKPKEVVIEFERNLYDELNLQREAANAAQLRRNFLNSSLLYVPEVYWDFVRENVLVIERIYGIPVTDLAKLRLHGINIKKLAERGLEIFFTQVFRDCFFHADMHPGNIFVSYDNLAEPQYICVDFGIMGTLNEQDKRYLAENLLAFFNRDYRKVAQLHIQSGWVDRHTPVAVFESAVRTVCEPIFEKPLKDISFAQVVLQLLQVTRLFKMEVQPQLVLLQKTLLAIEGLGRQLYPELDLWTTAKPYLEKWVREQFGLKNFLRQIQQNVPYYLEQLPNLPILINEVLLLKKDRELIKSELHNITMANMLQKQRKIRSTGFGIVSSLLIFAAISYSGYLTQQQLAMVAVAIAVLTGGIAKLFSSFR